MIGRIQKCISVLSLCAVSMVAAPLASALEKNAANDKIAAFGEGAADFTHEVRTGMRLARCEARSSEQNRSLVKHRSAEIGDQWKGLRDLERVLLSHSYNFMMLCASREELNDAEARWCAKITPEIDSGLDDLRLQVEDFINQLKLTEDCGSAQVTENTREL